MFFFLNKIKFTFAIRKVNGHVNFFEAFVQLKKN